MNWDVEMAIPPEARITAGELVELRRGAAWAAVQVLPQPRPRVERLAGVVLATGGLQEIRPGAYVSFERQQIAARIRCA